MVLFGRRLTIPYLEGAREVSRYLKAVVLQAGSGNSGTVGNSHLKLLQDIVV